ncbi:MAG: hypothetical protein AAFO82_05310 [Bacteroidota bacterium]
MAKFSILFLLIVGLNFCSFGQNNKQRRDIQFYFDNLPDTCFYLCDWRAFEEELHGKKVIDIRNGFMSFKFDGGVSDHFQIALFRGTNDKDIIAVSTRECEVPNCFNPTSFFFLYEDGNWIEADTFLLPEITIELFYDDPLNSKLANKYKSFFDYDYLLPRYGTEIKIELSICDYLQFDHPEVTDQQYDQLIQEWKPVYLKWEKSSNQFKLKTP